MMQAIRDSPHVKSPQRIRIHPYCNDAGLNAESAAVILDAWISLLTSFSTGSQPKVLMNNELHFQPHSKDEEQHSSRLLPARISFLGHGWSDLVE